MSRISFFISTILFVSIFLFVPYVSYADTVIPPADIVSLKAVSVGSTAVQFNWTAPGADGFVDIVSSYDMRKSASLFFPFQWNAQTQISITITPGQPGETESFTVSGLSPSTRYYFAIKGVDSLGNTSQTFNIVTVDTTASTVTTVNNVTFVPHLEGFFTNASTPFTTILFNVGSAVKVAEFTTTPHTTTGRIALPIAVSLVPGNYDILYSSQFYLNRKLSNYHISSFADISLPVLIAGDLNSDGIINVIDWSLMSGSWGNSVTFQAADINGDGVVNVVDWSFMGNNWNKVND